MTDIFSDPLPPLRKRIREQDTEIERLRAALTEAIEFITADSGMNWSLRERHDHVIKLRAALNPKVTT